MIDIHSHILWGLDDGSESLEESVAMLKAAAEAGTTDIVATPHSNANYRFDPDLIQSRIAELTDATGGVPRIHTGCDFHLSFENIEDAFKRPERYTINHKNYLLVEFPDLHIATALDGILLRFLEIGIVPIVTHPERNLILQQSIPRLEAWMQSGCLMQVTSLSLLGRFGRAAEKCAWELMERGLVHFLASDSHDPQDRHPRLDETYQAVARRYTEADAERLLVANPKAVLAGEPLPEPEGPKGPLRKKKGWLNFWN
jgi:protein-tyrosine phosphatase